MQRFALAVLLSAFGISGASAQQQQATRSAPPPSTAGELLSQGLEIKGVINDTYILVQKGDRAFLCGNANDLTWSNSAESTRDAPCKSTTRAN